MKKANCCIILLFFLITLNANGQVITKTDTALDGARKWFAAWEFMSKTVFGIDTLQPVEFVFFDTTNVYTTSRISIPAGGPVEGPALFGEHLVWRKAAHHGKITLPDHQEIPIGLMSFASPMEMEGKQAFFVMPLPEFWKSAGVKSEELGLENLVTGVFLHEFSHTQQMQSFGKKISDYEKKYVFNIPFSDDIVQDYFKKDSLYTAQFRKEVKVFYEAAAAKDPGKRKVLIRQGLQMLENRQQQYFNGDHEKLRQIDRFFLTMEGLGQYAMYAWLIDPRGGNIPEATALAGVRRGGRQWSQEEGLSLFLILDKLTKPKDWSKLMFGTSTVDIITLIEQKLN
jgi:hypothetical protein